MLRGRAWGSWCRRAKLCDVIGATYFSDPENERLIYLSAGALILFAIVVTVVTVWWWRSAKVDHPVLGPLEVMSTRAWEDSDRLARRQALEAVRPAHSDSSPSAGVAYVPMPEAPAASDVDDDLLEQFAANDVFDEYTRLTSGSAQPAPRRPRAQQQPVPPSESAPLPYDVERYHGYDEPDHDERAQHAEFDEHYDDEYGDVWGVQDAEEGLDAGYSIDPLLRRRDQF